MGGLWQFVCDSAASRMWKLLLLCAVAWIATVDANKPVGAICSLFKEDLTEVTDSEWDFYVTLESVSIEDTMPVPAVLYTFTTTDVLAAEVSETPYASAEFNLESSNLVISLTNEFVDYEVNNTENTNSETLYVTLRINCRTDNDGSVDGSLQLRFKITDTNNHEPIFSSLNYVYDLPMPFPIGISFTQIFESIIVIDADMSAQYSTISFTISADSPYENSFAVSAEPHLGKQTEAIIKPKELLRLDKSITLKLVATDTENVAEATITLNVDVEQSTPDNPRFEEPVYVSEISAEQIVFGNVITTLSVKISSGYSSELRYELKNGTNLDADGQYIGFTPNNEEIQFSWNATQEDLKSERVLSYRFTAIYEKGDIYLTGATVILLYLPSYLIEPTTPPMEPCTTPQMPTTTHCDCGPTTVCDPCTTVMVTTPFFSCPTTTEALPTTCPPCTTECPATSPSNCGTINPDDPQVVFDLNVYAVTVSPGFIGSIVTVKASSTEGNDVTYAFKDLPIDSITIDQYGVISIEAEILSGTYKWTVTATDSVNHVQGEATIILDVEYVSFCNEPSLAYSLLVKHADEEKELLILSGRPVAQCSYEFGSTFEINNYFEPDNKTGALTLKSIDRESTEFKGNNEEVVLTVTVTLNCIAEQKTWLDELGEYPTNTMVIHVILDDVNDNAPSFENESYVFGYPNRALSNELLPSFIGVAKAHDADISSKITYKLKEPQEKVILDEATGTVYPNSGNFTDEEFKFTVVASDSTFSSEAEIQVKILSAEYIFEVRIDTTLEDPNQIASKLSSLINLNVKLLSSSVIGTRSKIDMRAEIELTHKLVIYAVTNDKKIATFDEFKQKVEEISTDSGLQITSTAVWKTKAVTAGMIPESEKNNLIIGIAVLAVLLGIVLVGGLATYFLIFRKASKYSRHDHYSSESGSSGSNENNRNEKPALSDSPTSSRSSSPPNHPRQSVSILHSGESKDDVSMDGTVEENGLERRKSLVTFNQNVDLVEIEKL